MTRFAIFVFALFMCGAMSMLKAQVEVPKEVQGDEEFFNWRTMPIENGFNGFQVHPSGNIIIHRGNEFFDISGETGQLIRAFEVYPNHGGMRNFDISPDGKYFGFTLFGGSDGLLTYIYEYESGKVIHRKNHEGALFHFLSDSKHFAILSYNGGVINIYDLNGDSINTIKGLFSDFVFSPDGKYLLVDRIEKVMGVEHVFIELRDAKTFKLIKTLTELNSSNGVGAVYSKNTFSPDGKYLGLKIGGGNIWNLQEMKLQKHYSGNIYSSFCFLENDLIAHTGIEGNMPTFTLGDLRDEKNIRLFSIDSIGGGGIDYNKKLNSIIVLIPDFISLNLEKILSKVGVEVNTESPILVQYKDKLLTISNLSFEYNNTLAKIIDLQGNIVFQFPVALSQDNSVSIPISLPNGAYILSIDEQAYKFLVLE